MPDPFNSPSASNPGISSRDELVRALTGCDAQEGMAVSRTRRVVHGTVLNMEEQRTNRRKKMGVVLLASILFLTLLAPALWSSVDSFAAGAHFGDIQTQSYLLGVMLFPGIVAGAIAGFMRLRANSRQF
jgi:hypothetical protein